MNSRASQLSPRLALCASFVRDGSVVADIGTDHALLPIWLVSSGKTGRAIASDINEGPIDSARRNIARSGLNDRISTVVADGLAGIDPSQVNDIVIAGMGGDLIATILEAAPWVRDSRYRLILQPMSHADRLRQYLYAAGLVPEQEQAVRDSGRVYSVMCASYCGEAERPCTDAILYGGLLIGRTDEAAREYLERMADSLRTRASGLRTAGREEDAVRFDAIADELLG